MMELPFSGPGAHVVSPPCPEKTLPPPDIPPVLKQTPDKFTENFHFFQEKPVDFCHNLSKQWDGPAVFPAGASRAAQAAAPG